MLVQAESIPDKSVIDLVKIRYKKDGKYYHGVGLKRRKIQMV